MTPSKSRPLDGARLDGYDILILCGLAALGTGIGLISVPAALIAVGAILMAIGIFGALSKGVNPQ